MKRNIVVAITGASGVTYSVRLLEVLLAAGCDVHLTISAAGQTVLEQELDLSVDLDNFNPAMLMLDSGEILRDPKLQLLRSKAGISGDSSNVLGMGAGEPGILRYLPPPRLPRPDRQRLVPDRRHGRLPLLLRHAERDRPRHERQPDPPRRRGPPEGAPQADPRAPRNAAFAARRSKT